MSSTTSLKPEGQLLSYHTNRGVGVGAGIITLVAMATYASHRFIIIKKMLIFVLSLQIFVFCFCRNIYAVVFYDLYDLSQSLILIGSWGR